MSYADAKALLLGAFRAKMVQKQLYKGRIEHFDLIILRAIWGRNHLNRETELRARGEPIMESQDFRYIVLEYLYIVEQRFPSCCKKSTRRGHHHFALHYLFVVRHGSGADRTLDGEERAGGIH